MKLKTKLILGGAALGAIAGTVYNRISKKKAAEEKYTEMDLVMEEDCEVVDEEEE